MPPMRGGWRWGAGDCASMLCPLLSIPVSICLGVSCPAVFPHLSPNACTFHIKMDVQHYLEIRETELPFIKRRFLAVIISDFQSKSSAKKQICIISPSNSLCKHSGSARTRLVLEVCSFIFALQLEG